MVAGALAAGVLWACTTGIAAQNLAAVGEVTAVVDGDQPGTVLVETLRDGTAGTWRVDDAGKVVGWLEATGGARGGPQARQCLGDECYRVPGDALRVEHSTDGGATFGPVWEVNGATYTTLTSRYPDLGDPVVHLSSRSLVVHAAPGGQVVFVADGRDGLLYRDVHGGWHRLGVPDSGEGCCFYAGPLRLSGRGPLARLAVPVGVVVGLVVLLPGLIVAVRRRDRRPLPVVVTVAALAGAVAGVVTPLEDVGMFSGVLYAVPIVLVVAVGGSLLTGWVAATGPDTPPARPITAGPGEP